MRKPNLYMFTWESGIITYARGYDRTEKENMIRKYGKLISKVLVAY